MTADSHPFAGIELGGTKCICVLASLSLDIVDQASIPTTDPATTLAQIEAVLDRWHGAGAFQSLGLASFGPLDLDPGSASFGTIMATPKPGWAGTPLRARLAARYPVPVGIQTDVGAAALAEGRWGAAIGLANYIYITVGTGIGAGIVIAGQLVGGHLPVEAGHMRVGRVAGDDWPGACAFHGDCVEGLASGAAIAARTGRLASALAVDDPAWDYMAHAIGGLIHNLLLTTAPQKIIVGGGVAQRRPQLIDRVRAAVGASIEDYVRVGALDDIIVAPALGDRAGPMGAVGVARDAALAPTKF
jgi:fructokinase